jgi:proline iminopeptidase
MAVQWTRRGRIDGPGGQIAYGVVGEGERTVLTLHGGPGVPSQYIHSMADLASNELSVVFYDQLGCGASDRPDDPALWTVDRFVMEAEAVRTALDLGRVDLWGHSWGGMLAQEYALAHPEALRTLCLASTICSASFHRQELLRLIDGFPEETAAPLRDAYNGGDTTSPRFRSASAEFWDRHVCRIPSPPEVQSSVDQLATNVLETMWGPDDVAMRGRLARWEAADRIGAIDVPTLVTVGAHDSLTPASSRMISERIADSELVIFPNSSHHAHWEERERYVQVVRDFLETRGFHPNTKG